MHDRREWAGYIDIGKCLGQIYEMHDRREWARYICPLRPNILSDDPRRRKVSIEPLKIMYHALKLDLRGVFS